MSHVRTHMVVSREVLYGFSFCFRLTLSTSDTMHDGMCTFGVSHWVRPGWRHTGAQLVPKLKLVGF